MQIPTLDFGGARTAAAAERPAAQRARGARAPMPDRPLLLICDHRGRGVFGPNLEAAAAGWRLSTSAHLAESLARIAAEPPDLVLLDPLAGGTRELRALKGALRTEFDMPVLVVAGPGEASPLLGHPGGCGSWDMVAPGVSPEELRLRLSRLAEESRLRREMHELRHRASHDDRTDLLRPQAFQTRLNEHFSAAQRHRLHLVLVLMDLDRFGRINKEHDHTVGDALIAQVGEVVRRNLRTEDVAGRLGGDEFAVLLPYTRRADAVHVVERLREGIHRLSVRPAGAPSDIEVSASIGYESFDGQDLGSVQELRQRAERALREAKRRGGNQALYFRALEPA